VDGKEGDQQTVVFNKAVDLGLKVHCRLYCRVVKRFQIVKTRSMETIDKLGLTTDPKTLSNTAISTVSNAPCSSMKNAVTRVTGSAWSAVTNMVDLVANTLTKGMKKSPHTSPAEEAQSDTSNTEQYDDHSCDNHESSANNSQQ